jgi:hypothetical protein
MIDYADMTEAIRAFLGSTDPRQDQAMTDLAAAYATACKEANDRLRRCIDFIRRGMRTEASSPSPLWTCPNGQSGRRSAPPIR